MALEQIDQLIRVYDEMDSEEFRRRLVSMFGQLNDRIAYISDRIDITYDTQIAELQASIQKRIGVIGIADTSDMIDTDYMAILNGQELSRTTHAALWDLKSAYAVDEGSKTEGEYGTGDGSTTFTVPDWTTNERYFRATESDGGVLQDENVGRHRHEMSARDMSSHSPSNNNTISKARSAAPRDDYQGEWYESDNNENRPITVKAVPFVWVA